MIYLLLNNERMYIMKYLLTLLVILLSVQFLKAQIPGTKKWVYELESGSSIHSSPSIGTDGTIYVGVRAIIIESAYWYYVDAKLLAINPDSTKKWEFETDGSVVSSPSIGTDGIVYVGTTGGKLYAVNPDGTKKWEFQTNGGILSSPAIDSDGTVYIGTCNATYTKPLKMLSKLSDYSFSLYAINPDGTKKWTFEAPSIYGIDSSPAIGSDGTIYFCSDDDFLYALNADSSKKWDFQIPCNYGVYSSPAINSNGTIFVGSSDSNLYAINPNGTKKWTYQTGGKIKSSPAIASDGTIFVGSKDGNLYAINPNGTKKWSYQTGSNEFTSSPAIGSSGTIYFASRNFLYAFNSDGTKKWELSNAGSDQSPPAISTDGTVYIGAGNGLNAIYSESKGLLDSPWPKFGHDNQNTGNYLHVTSIEEQNIIELPNEFVLYPLYPNPFNPSTQIKFSLPKASIVEIEIYNVTGQFIGKLLNGKKKAGTFIISWDASNLATGMYFVRMKAGSFVKTHKCLLVK